MSERIGGKTDPPERHGASEAGPGERPVQSDWQSGIRPGSVRTHPDQLSEQPLNRAQRWYLARLQRGCEFAVAAAALWLLALALQTALAQAAALGAALLGLVLLLGALALGSGFWRLATGDPAFRTDSVLFILAWLGRALAIAAALGFAAFTLASLAGLVLSAPPRIAGPAALLGWSARTALLALTLLVLWSLLARTEGPPRRWLVLLGLLASLLLFPLHHLAPGHWIQTAAAALAWIPLAALALVLRARVGGIRRVLEQAEPGPAFAGVQA